MCSYIAVKLQWLHLSYSGKVAVGRVGACESPEHCSAFCGMTDFIFRRISIHPSCNIHQQLHVRRCNWDKKLKVVNFCYGQSICRRRVHFERELCSVVDAAGCISKFYSPVRDGGKGPLFELPQESLCLSSLCLKMSLYLSRPTLE
jgi:hypothetical protein